MYGCHIVPLSRDQFDMPKNHIQLYPLSLHSCVQFSQKLSLIQVNTQLSQNATETCKFSYKNTSRSPDVSSVVWNGLERRNCVFDINPTLTLSTIYANREHAITLLEMNYELEKLSVVHRAHEVLFLGINRCEVQTRTGPSAAELP